jgi:endonuclease/exonuclease/phosphatase family metal-dependent hydrolase
MPEITVACLNLRGIRDRWRRREPLVVEGLAGLGADVICVQEAATWCLQARWLAWRLGRTRGQKYHVRQARKRGWRGALEGIAILSRLPLGRHDVLDLGGGRIGLRTSLQPGGAPLVVVNTHLAHRSRDGAVRENQSRALLRWLGRATPAVVAGDLNDTPESAALRAFEGVWRAAHEPGALAGTAPAWERRRVIDYILVSEAVDVLEAGTFLDAPVNGRWPSDHIGLWAKLRF